MMNYDLVHWYWYHTKSDAIIIAYGSKHDLFTNHPKETAYPVLHEFMVYLPYDPVLAFELQLTGKSMEFVE